MVSKNYKNIPTVWHSRRDDIFSGHWHRDILVVEQLAGLQSSGCAQSWHCLQPGAPNQHLSSYPRQGWVSRMGGPATQEATEGLLQSRMCGIRSQVLTTPSLALPTHPVKCSTSFRLCSQLGQCTSFHLPADCPHWRWRLKAKTKALHVSPVTKLPLLQPHPST